MKNNFHAALIQANILYDIEMPEEDFEEVGLIAWNLIGNKNTRLYKYSGEINKTDLSLELPCNVDIIEAVTTDFEDWNETSNILPSGGDINSSATEEFIENNKKNVNNLYISGKYVDYNQLGRTLYFNEDFGRINVLYKGIEVDEDGLPYLNDKEVLAIATFIAYQQKFKEGLRSNNANLIQVSQTLETLWYRRCDQARIPEYISQNEMNEILDAKTSWNRKMYNKSYKPLK